MYSEKYRTDFLFCSSNILTGIASLLNLQGNYFTYNYSRTNEEADNKAIENDWGVIGQDLKTAIYNKKIDSDNKISDKTKSKQLALFD